MAASDIMGREKEVEVPILAVGGAQDMSTPPKMVRKVVEGAMRGRYIEIDPGTHMMVMEHAEVLVEILEDFRKAVDDIQV